MSAVLQLSAAPSRADPKAVLSKALLNAGRLLGLSQAEIGEVVGKDRTSITRGLDPASKSGELALLLIRCYRSLYVLVGGESADLRHWMYTQNRDTGGVPAQQVRSVQGLTRVLEYLDAMRGRV
ncbi:MAG TPA: MbcA/ParS/Xre antitoxin family protein [Lamprocystis sp. (in: g-proteobacteria)]|nr:MbcA/ParS/Xre antitoxin family protein [Lamprocystis sp. (in: g-proteobacteria)]